MLGFPRLSSRGSPLLSTAATFSNPSGSVVLDRELEEEKNQDSSGKLVAREIVQAALRDVFASGHFSPHPISQEELRGAFNPAMEWNVATIEPDRIQTSYHDDGWTAGSRQSTQIISVCAQRLHWIHRSRSMRWESAGDRSANPEREN
jgi:hypothetical protein